MDNMSDLDNERPHLSVNAQYIKDLSFENPRAPGVLGANKSTPKVNVALDVHIKNLSDENVFEVSLHIEVSTFQEDEALFNVELKYAGVFSLMNLSGDHQNMVLAVHCPAMLFPYARKIISDVTQDGGFQPLMIDPIDFGMLYHKKIMEKKREHS